MLLLKNVKFPDSSFVYSPKVGAYGRKPSISRTDPPVIPIADEISPDHNVINLRNLLHFEW